MAAVKQSPAPDESTASLPMNSKYDIELPQSVVDSFARFLVPEIRKYYESEEGRKAFEEWQQENK